MDKNHCSGTGEGFSEHKAWLLKGTNVCHDLRIFRESEEKALCIYMKLWKGIRTPQENVTNTHAFPYVRALLLAAFPQKSLCSGRVNLNVLPAGAEGVNNP